MRGLHLGLGLSRNGLISAVTGAVPEIWLGFGDSVGVGIDARDGAVDLDWPNVYQVRQRAPTGISSDISPLDQAIVPTGTDFLSSYEYFGKQRAADIGAAVYLVPHNYNGTRLGATSTDWGLAGTLSDGFISRSNAAIQTVRAVVPTAVLGGIIMCEGTNDGAASVNPTTYNTNLNAMIPYIRTRIFKNGVSGADASTLPFLINGIMPESLPASGYMGVELKLRETAATITNGKFYRMPEGIARPADNIHPSAAGMRVVGPANAAIIKDTTAPVISTPATYTQYAGQNMLIELVADKYAWWTTSNTTDYEIISIADGPSGIGASRLRWYLRWLSDGTKTAGTYSTTITAKDASGNTSSITRTDTVVTAYGTQVGTITATSMTTSTGVTTNDLRSRTILPVSLGAGMNVITISRNTGGASDVSSVAFNGILATRDANSGGTTQVYYLPSAVAQTGNLVITPNASAILSIGCTIVCLTGTVATPSSSSVMQNASRATPHLTASLTCPTNGIIVGGGIIPNIGTATSGETELVRNGFLFTATRTTDGSLGAAGQNLGFSWLSASAFAKA
jgi:lysophospholipase L1-like esterase